MPRTKEVVVIGGGIIGLCSAYYLQKNGHTVTILEQGDFLEGASLGNAGMLVPSHVVPLAAPGVISQGIRWLFRRDSPFRIKPRVDPALAAWLWKFRSYCTEAHVEAAMPVLRDLSLASVECFAELAKLFDFDFSRRGLLMVHRTEKGEKENLKYAKKAKGVGLDVEVLTKNQLHALEPCAQDSMTGAVYYAQDAHINPGAFIKTLREALLAEGVVCKSGISVQGFEVSQGKINKVLTSSGSFAADDIILAAGSWSSYAGKLLGLKLPIQPAKGYSVTMEMPQKSPQIPMILTEDKVTVTPMGNFLRFGGTLELAGFDNSVDRVRASSILNAIPDYVEGADPASIKTRDIWSGFRPCTPDGLPMIGRSTSVNNLVIATGHAMIGITLGPITGQLVSEIVNDQTSEIDIDLLHPERFSSGMNRPLPTNNVSRKDAIGNTH